MTPHELGTHRLIPSHRPRRGCQENFSSCRARVRRRNAISAGRSSSSISMVGVPRERMTRRCCKRWRGWGDGRRGCCAEVKLLAGIIKIDEPDNAHLYPARVGQRPRTGPLGGVRNNTERRRDGVPPFAAGNSTRACAQARFNGHLMASAPFRLLGRARSMGFLHDTRTA
jgi:hypothetical protein